MAEYFCRKVSHFFATAVVHSNCLVSHAHVFGRIRGAYGGVVRQFREDYTSGQILERQLPSKHTGRPVSHSHIRGIRRLLGTKLDFQACYMTEKILTGRIFDHFHLPFKCRNGTGPIWRVVRVMQLVGNWQIPSVGACIYCLLEQSDVTLRKRPLVVLHAAYNWAEDLATFRGFFLFKCIHLEPTKAFRPEAGAETHDQNVVPLFLVHRGHVGLLPKHWQFIVSDYVDLLLACLLDSFGFPIPGIEMCIFQKPTLNIYKTL